MSQLHQALLPLDELDDQQFESFLLHFLSAGISLEVVEEVISQDSRSPSSRLIREKLVNTHVGKYGSAGRAGQRGIDLRAVTESGHEWVFQCKHYRSGFSGKQALAAVELAEQKYPNASHYFLVLSEEPVPEVHDVVDQRSKWTLLGRTNLNSIFFNEVPRDRQIEILRRVFPVGADAVIRRLFPIQDDLLIDAVEYFQRWLEEDRIFHHRAALVGREETLQSLRAFVEDPEARVLILPAAGGVGKTRILRAFGDEFSGNHPKRMLWFVNPYARPETSSDRLRVAKSDALVVVQDDAHRTEILRADIASTVCDKAGKMIFATRPHGVDGLISWLSTMGVDHSRIRTLPKLQTLSRDDRLTLARQCLPESKQGWAEDLAQLAQACTLIITVGARLIAEKDISPATYLDSKEFQVQVFDRLEQGTLAQLASADGSSGLKATLRLLAMVAPWNQNLLSLDAAAKLIDLTPREFMDHHSRLRSAGMLVETREGWRVVPDLFADHLVYRACYDEAGNVTSFARRVQTALVGKFRGTVLRNLAEAEWQAQLNGQAVESLLDPFWAEIVEGFFAVSFWERSQLIVEWKRFAVYQPDRTLQLARLAMDLTEAPEPLEDTFGWMRTSSINTRNQVLSELPTLIEPIAFFHAENRWEALDLLWELHRIRDHIDENAQNEPLAVIGKVARFKHRHPPDAPIQVVRWLADRFQQGKLASFSDEPSVALSVVLKPVFEREIEHSYTTGNTVHFQSYPLSATNTRETRNEALMLVRDHMLPKGEVAVLNSLPVLDAAMDMMRRRWGGEVTAEMEAPWLPDRRAALSLVEQLIVPHQSPRVLYRILRLLRPLVGREPYAPFQTECERVMALIPDSPELRLARVLLSGAWEEFYYYDPKKESSASEAHPRIDEEWDRLGDMVAADFLEKHPTANELLGGVERLVDEYQRSGISPQFSDFFSALARCDAAMSADCIDLLLARDASPVDRWWPSLFITHRKLPDARLQKWTSKVLQSDNSERSRRLLASLRWVGIGDIGEETIEEIAKWAARLNDHSLLEVIPEIRWSGERERLVEETILTNLNLSQFSDDSLDRICEWLDRNSDWSERKMPAEFICRFIDELHRVESLGKWDSQAFLKQLANLEPLRFYEMLRSRVEEFESRQSSETSFCPLPSTGEKFPLTGLLEQDSYSIIARGTFDRWRSAQKFSRYWWRYLFQNVVLCVSEIGLELLREWLDEAENPDELEEIIDALKFDGSMIIFNYPDFVREVLVRVRTIAPTRFRELSYSLRDSASPTMRGYTNHTLDPEFRYYREAALKGSEVHSRTPELSSFYREIIRAEDAEEQRLKRWSAQDNLDWE